MTVSIGLQPIFLYPGCGRSGGAPVVTWLHRDQLDSVVLIASASGGEDLERIYAPFGEDTEYGLPGGEDFGFVGERKDAVAGLQYLKARYYDPELAMFIQPDWVEVTRPGVGTNRYAYAGNDPVNLWDPGGNFFLDEKTIEELISKAAPAAKTVAKTGIGVGLRSIFGAIGLALTPTTMANGTYQPELTDEDRRSGFDYDRKGNLTKNGFPADVSQLPSLQGTPSSPLAESIANGHGQGHLDEFQNLGVENTDDLASLVAETIAHPTHSKTLSNDRNAYYNEYNNTLVIEDPNHPDKGTVFSPTNGLEYYENDLE